MRLDTLYVTDLDGTLFDPTSSVSDESVKILNSLIDRGAMITYATARTPATVQPLLSRIRQAHTPSGRAIPAIVMTGAAYWDRNPGEYVYTRFISREGTQLIREALAEENINAFEYTLGERGILNVYHSAKLTTREDNFYQERRHLTLKRFHLGQHPSDNEPTVLFFGIASPEKAERLCSGLRRLGLCSPNWYLDIFNPGVALIDIYAPDCSKSFAVKDLADKLGCTRTVVFGDNLNDIPMLEVADLAVAMENADPAAKEAADVVIGPNTRPSVARFIAEDFEG